MEKSPSVIKFVMNDKTFYSKTMWKPNQYDLFHIRLYDGDTTWSGRFSYEFAKKYKDRFEETEEQYYDNVKKGLSKDQNFNYVFATQLDDDNFATFSWKKKFEDSFHGIAYLVHGSVPLHREEVTASKDYLVDFLFAENEDLRAAIATLSFQNNELANHLDNCRKDLDKFMDMKTSLETSLYDKFVQLLSAKKRKIQLLEKNIGRIVDPIQTMDELD